MKNHIVIYNSLQTPCKILVLKFSRLHQIAGFFKMQYLEKEKRGQVDFFHVYQSFLQADTVVFGGHDQACPKYTKQTSL